ncbi:MAG: asparaginase [Pseudomonadales bacterium]|nr:asparaginase [Pseudomonadales bacterium]MBO6564355.1 asparaginase [Pseudomonadales bacterium]MBO6595438.1 asparaginase [Pseudomonadales bacterium]MBO6657559.1 asparaginase [Pseudomonadales bacterium]MBO6701938.1 asparaginase [Pseudomonadales bacterium]
MTLLDPTREILIITTGGTIDKVYFDDKSDYQVGRTIIGRLLEEAQVTHPNRIIEALQKDSLHLNEKDRETIKNIVLREPNGQVVITHGTDTMADTARYLSDITEKTIVLTGALSPARFAMTDAMFNIGMAIAAAQSLEPGVYIAMNGTVFPAKSVFKNREMNRFERK